MAALFIYVGRIGVLLSFLTGSPPLFGTVGLPSTPSIHPGFQDDSGSIILDDNDLKSVSFIYSTTLSTHPCKFTTTPVGHASVNPCPGLHNTGLTFIVE